jgi:hypothetical protein
MKAPLTAIEALNESSAPQIDVFVARDTRTVARLPRVGREVQVEDADPAFSGAKVTADDIAWLCEEARRTSAPGMAFFEAALSALGDLDDRD